MTRADRPSVLLEVCVDDADRLAAAIAGGADRIELCADLSVGGLTPDAAFMKRAAACGRPVHVMIRPRSGDFRFSSIDAERMQDAIVAAKAAGVVGVVVGAVREDGALDAPLLARLVAAARPLSVTLHRAFDVTPDPFAALDVAIALGIDRVLTSGQAASATEGATLIRDLVARADGRIVVMAGVGITSANAVEVVRRTGVSEVHGSFRGDAAEVRAARAALDEMAGEKVLEVQP